MGQEDDKQGYILLFCNFNIDANAFIFTFQPSVPCLKSVSLRSIRGLSLNFPRIYFNPNSNFHPNAL